MIKSVKRALDILLYLAENKEVGIRELARLLDVNAATAFRLLSTLEEKKFVCKDPVTKKYQLGPETIRIGYCYLSNLNLVQVARPYLQQLSHKINETVCLLIREEVFYGTYIDKIDSNHALRVHAQIGAKVPLYTGSAAKAITAHLPFEEQEKILDEFVSSPPTGNFDKEKLRKELEEIRKSGYAISKEEVDPGVIAIGSPVFGFDNQVVGAVGVPLPKERATPQHLQQVAVNLKETCAKISRQLGYRL